MNEKPIDIDPSEAQSEIEAQKWHPNVVRMRMHGLVDAKLEQMTRDESLRQVERDVAGDILLQRQHDADTKAGVERRAEARAAARATIDALPETKQLPAVTGQRRGTEGLSKNQAAAERFAAILRRRGFNALARATKRIQGRDVLDGWAVNVRDDTREVGVVAAWWGRGHFTCFFEITGHCDRTEEAAELMGVMLGSLEVGGLELVDRRELEELRRRPAAGAGR